MIERLHNPWPVTRTRVFALLALFLCAFAARAGYGIYRAGPGVQYDDEHWYWEIGQSYRAGEGMVGEFGHRAERMPLFPWMLSLFATPASARPALWAIGALAAVFATLLAARFCRWPWLAGLIVALDPALVGSSSLLLTETPAVTVGIALWWLAWPLHHRVEDRWWRWLLVGATAALGVYLREATVVTIAAMLVFLVAVRRDRRVVGGGIAVVLIVLAALTPWAARNQRVIGDWRWLTTRGGISLYDGVRPGATGASDLGDVKAAAPVAGLDEVAWDAHFREASWRAIRGEPLRILALVPVKLARTWSPVLHAAEYQSRMIRLVFAGWYIPLYLLAVAGVVLAWRRYAVWIWLLLPALCVCLLHAVFVGSVRYRLTALPALAILAALGISLVVERWRGRAQSRDGRS